MRRFILTFVLTLLLCALSQAQGRSDYLNVESPPVHPIEIFRFQDHDYLGICNTRDSSLEIWDTVEQPTPRLLARIPVGLEPVSVRYYRKLSKLYTANFLGDSVSIIDVIPGKSASQPVEFHLDRTSWVGDEPMDLAFFRVANSTGTAQHTLFVSHLGLDGLDWRKAHNLRVLDGREMQPAKVQLDLDLTDPPGGVPDDHIELALKEPRTLLVRDGNLLALAGKGGNSVFDFDIYCDSLDSPFEKTSRLTGLGSTGFSMEFDKEGVLYVVGAEALNRQLAGEPNLKDAPTGFVKSMIYRIEGPCSDVPTIQARDVNLAPVKVASALSSLMSWLGLLLPVPPVEPVSHRQALSQLTDLAIYEGPDGTQKVFFTAFGSDRVGILEAQNDGNSPLYWPLRRIEIHTRNGNPMAGPRGIAVKPANLNGNSDPTARIYVLNHLDASVTVIDPVTEKVLEDAGFSLTNDPRPSYLTQGQQFLYDARLSGNGMVSCASCHTDGRTDGLAWDLGTPGSEEEEIPKILLDTVDDTHFPADKGPMVTQSLQGLINFEVLPHNQFWVTNGPYHWRGDRADFTKFNGAFESLLGSSRLTELQMKQFEAFVFSIHYPPNPKQLASRRPSGSFDRNPTSLAEDRSTSASRGLKLFHSFPSVGPRTCVHCHALPEGSNNRITDPMGAVGQPIESAALRGLFQKEAKRDLDGSSHPKDSPYTGLEGLFHTGFIPNSDLHEINLVGSINGFNKAFFSSRICGTPGELSFCEDLQDLNQFVHEFDWGVAPLVGCAVTLRRNDAEALLAPPPEDPCNLGCSDPVAALACMRDQSEKANVGIIAQAWLGGQVYGYWWDPHHNVFREIGNSDAIVPKASLAGLVKSKRDRIVIEAVPLGDERRLASENGDSGLPLSGPAPGDLRLLPLVPTDFYRDVPRMTQGWANFDNSQVQSLFVHTVRLFQWGLIQDASAADGFGLIELRHDAPRRMRISGSNIRPGAWLHLAYPSDPGSGPIDPKGPVSQVNVEVISFPLYASGKWDPNSGKPIFETAVELEPLIYYGLMLGGPTAPGVAKAYLDTEFEFPLQDPVTDQPQPGQFDPMRWNYLYVLLTNEDNTWAAGGWQRLRLQP